MYYPLLQGKKIGVVANKASVAGNANIVDVLVNHGFQVVRIFSPEHGFRNSVGAGELIDSSLDSVTGISVVSLYGKKKKPASTDLDGLDLILFDLQDVGVRFYTYISTLTYMMEACAVNKTPLVVLDRPNPNGFYIDGPVLEDQFRSFVGLHPVPVVYGMTIGEYAQMVNGEGWLKNKVRCDLKVIPLEKYAHQTRVELPVVPSPNLPNKIAVMLYPSLCFFEGTKISIGRGTQFPFQVYGHPELGRYSFKFKPVSIPGASLNPPCEGFECHGEDLREYYADNPGDSGKIILKWLIGAFKAWQGNASFFNDYFNTLAGNATLQQQIIQGKSEEEIRSGWEPGLTGFRKIRAKYLLYE
jgi:uncharacterized protein YbbC (DUF1343 family)